jgi:transcription initiation factor TFIIIB Brf1 subunit/transcription initiation factor TFIIB
MMDNVALVFKTFKESEKPLKGGEVAEISGIDKKEVDKAIKVLKKEEKIISPKRCFYEAKK